RSVEATQEPDLLGPLHPDVPGKQPRAEPPVEAAHPRPGLAAAGVVGGARQVAYQVEDVPAAHRPAGDHGHHGFRGATDLHMEVAHVEAPDAPLSHLVVADISVIAADPLVATRAERL